MSYQTYLSAVQRGEEIANRIVKMSSGRERIEIGFRHRLKCGIVLDSCRRYLTGYPKLTWLTERAGWVEVTKA